MKKTGILFILAIVAAFSTGCSKSTYYGNVNNWEVELVQQTNREKIKLKICYIGSEQTIKDFSYKFK